MEQISEFLGKALRRMDRPEAAMAWLSSAWPTIVGKALAEHARPLRCQSGCLELAVDGKPWQRQLESMKREICIRINQAWGGKLVSEVKFASGGDSCEVRNCLSTPGPSRVSVENDNEHIPFIRRRRA
jgi:predicted nucleic acid-binding Zn ribbon protein